MKLRVTVEFVISQFEKYDEDYRIRLNVRMRNCGYLEIINNAKYSIDPWLENDEYLVIMRMFN